MTKTILSHLDFVDSFDSNVGKKKEIINDIATFTFVPSLPFPLAIYTLS